MSTKEAAEFILRAAFLDHEFDCDCVSNGKIQDGIKCSCGATEHNTKVFEAFQQLRVSADQIGIVKIQIGVKSPMWKYS